MKVIDGHSLGHSLPPCIPGASPSRPRWEITRGEWGCGPPAGIQVSLLKSPGTSLPAVLQVPGNTTAQAAGEGVNSSCYTGASSRVGHRSWVPGLRVGLPPGLPQPLPRRAAGGRGRPFCFGGKGKAKAQRGGVAERDRRAGGGGCSAGSSHRPPPRDRPPGAFPPRSILPERPRRPRRSGRTKSIHRERDEKACRVKIPETKERSYSAEFPVVYRVNFKLVEICPGKGLVSQGVAKAGTTSQSTDGLALTRTLVQDIRLQSMEL
ncbi:uncharacterized protein LOC121092525 [Falco naumanni]|uniref:uncharacterized protein LOC121092525 n=1 Tax=Falco naumanni TaxID=148594 RepID=UPI001ADE75FF|nr:uncharacterized protein LOC121092525 [Falco naumanni]